MKTHTLLFTIGFIVIIVAAWLIFKPVKKEVSIPLGANADQIFLTTCTEKIEGVPYQADCGTLVVSELRSDPDANLIALPVKRIHSTNPNPLEPIFYLEGGPGMSNMHFTPPDWMLAQHDVVMVGYRGADGSPKLDCPEISRAIKGVNGDLLSDTSLENLGVAMKTCSSRLEASGVDLKGYTIPEVVNDMESARKLLGYKRIDLLSGSYGTRVA